MPPPRAPYPGALAAGAARRVGGRRASPGPWLRSWAVQLRAGPQRPGSGRPRGGRTAPGGAEPGRAGPRCALLPPPPPRAAHPPRLREVGGGSARAAPSPPLHIPVCIPGCCPRPPPGQPSSPAPDVAPFSATPRPPPSAGFGPICESRSRDRRVGAGLGGGGAPGTLGWCCPGTPWERGKAPRRLVASPGGRTKKGAKVWLSFSACQWGDAASVLAPWPHVATGNPLAPRLTAESSATPDGDEELDNDGQGCGGNLLGAKGDALKTCFCHRELIPG